MCVCAYVGACAPYLANISKIVQDATRAGTQAPERPQATTTRAAPEPERPPQERERDHSERTSAGTRARAYKKKLQKQ